MANYYKSSKHRHWRERVLRADEYMCQSCKRRGVNIDGNHAHHILPRSMYPQYQAKAWNGIALCETCHNEIEPRTGEYKPPEWMLRRLPDEAEHERNE